MGSYSVSSGALESPGLLLSYSITTLALHNTILIVTNTHHSTPKSIQNRYLANEGLSLSTKDEQQGTSEEEKTKRQRAQQDKKKKLVNPLFAVSALRLSIRNLKKEVSDKELRNMCVAATQAGLRKKLVTENDLQSLHVADGTPLSKRKLPMPSFGNGGKKHGIRSAKIMLDMDRVRELWVVFRCLGGYSSVQWL